MYLTKYTRYTKVVYMVYEDASSMMSRIVKAASDLVLTYGVKGWNMESCAKAAGITKRTLYQHIDNKEKLIEHVLLQFIRSVQNDLAQQFIHSSDYPSSLSAMMQIFPQMIMRMESTIIQDIFLTYPEIEKTIITKRLEIANESLALIKQGQKEGYIREDIEADIILEIFQSLVLFYGKSNPHQFETRLREAFKIVLSGILREGIHNN